LNCDTFSNDLLDDDDDDDNDDDNNNNNNNNAKLSANVHFSSSHWL
jgi:hypothetical protein